MKNEIRRIAAAILGTALIALHGCGGSPGGVADDTITMSGVAATGAAFVGATVEVSNSSGVVGTSDPVGSTGKFSFKLTKGAKPPFVLKASRTNVDGAVESLVSVYSGSGISASANITPISNLIASRLSPSGDPLKLAAELAAAPTVIDFDKIVLKVKEVQTILAPILAATGTTASDPLTADFPTDGTGYDRLLDSVKITVTPSSETTTNIEIGVKQQLADTAAPITIQFNNTTVLAAIPVMPTIDASTLVASGTSALITQHLAQLTACYALPLTTRVNGVVGGNNNATGTAANVVAPECRNAFFGNDPANFKSNGNLVGRDTNNNGAFAGLFRNGATGAVFSQGTYEFTRQNGDVVIGYKSKDAAANEVYDTFAVRKDTDGKLKQIGNQYAFGGGVTAYQQLREFLNQPASNYYSTGYAVGIPLITASGRTVTHVIITTPKNTNLTMIRGSDGMVFPKLNSSRQTVEANGTTLSTAIPGMGASGTSFIRVRSEYSDAASVAAHPAARDTGLFFTPTDSTEAEVASFGNQSVWTFKYYSGGTAAPLLEGTQSYKTRARALTIGEMRTKKWANLNAAGVALLQSQYELANNITTLPSANFVTPVWEVPAGALPPTGVTLFGSTRVNDASLNTDPRVQFNDSITVGSTVRTASIACANGNGELHCAPPGYKAYSRMSGLHLWARDPAGNDFAHFYAGYKLN
jgi:hypothetical protein